MAYTPDIRKFQQLVYGGATGSVDCSAWAGAIECAAHTQGNSILSGRSIRLASNEPVPDPRSPGLNVTQVDAAVYKLTGGRVNFDTPWPGSFGRVATRDRVIDGQWVHIAVKRAILVDRGYGGSSGFRGSHAITIHHRSTDLAPIIGDPLVPYYYSSTWDAVLDAAQAVTASGDIFASFSRDLTTDYRAVVRPRAGADTRVFYRYLVSNGRITGRTRHRTAGFTATCTPPRTHTGTLTRELVQLTSGSRKGWWISATYAREA
jgi:hypothetical protein